MTDLSIDFDAINAAAIAGCPGLLQRWFPAGKLYGNEFKVGNLVGDAGDSLSVNIKSGKWSDFATGDKGGDLVSLYAGKMGISNAEAGAELARLYGVGPAADKGSTGKAKGGTKRKRTTRRKRKAKDDAPIAPPEWQPLAPAAPLPSPVVHPQFGEPDDVYLYMDAAGELLGAVCRWDATPFRGKVILPLSYGRADGIEGWHHKHMLAPRSLYGLNELAAFPRLPVLVVEGEKTVHAARLLVADAAVVVCWPGGSSAIAQVDWTPLAGRAVTIWPDRDRKKFQAGHPKADEEKPASMQPGMKAAERVAAAIAEEVGTCRVVDPPEDLADGWDLADARREGWDGARVLAWMAEHAREPDPDSLEADDGGTPPPDDAGDDDRRRGDCPLSALGHKAGKYYFLSPAGEIRSLEGRLMSEAGISSLVDGDVRFFAGEFLPKGRAEVFTAGSARNFLMRECFRAGPFAIGDTVIRGPGVWLDGGKLVVHCGDQVMVDGVWRRAGFMLGEVVYHVAARTSRPAEKPGSSEYGKRLEKAFGLWQYASPIGAKVMTGFVGAAMLGGATRWRAHAYAVARARLRGRLARHRQVVARESPIGGARRRGASDRPQLH